MADKKISALTGAATPLAGTEVLPIVQSGATVKVAVSDLTAGRAVETGILTTTTLGTAGNTVLDTVYKTGSTGSVISRLQTAAFSSSVLDLETNDGSGSNYRLGTTIYDSTISNSYAGANLWGNLNFATGGVIRATIVGGTGATAGDLTVKTGNLVIGTAGKGIDFSATSGTGTSELLADYEEGTFTAVVTMGSGTATVSSANDLMSYTKVGRLVTINGQFHISATSTPSGTMKITLPFSVANGSEGDAFSVGGAMRIFNQVLPVGLYPVIQANNNDNTASLFMNTSAGTLTNMLPIADGFFMISLTYIV